jgi:radical SAM superfamily enzyme YgiQ (UPF0313 family)
VTPELRQPGAVLLVSTYELGHAPHGLAMPLAFLRRAGFQPAVLDLAVEALDRAAVARARVIAISVPMHTALRMALAELPRLRALAPGAAIGFYGLYAALDAGALLAGGAAFALGGESEEALVRAVESHGGGARSVTLARLDFPAPARDLLPAAERYAHLVVAGGRRTAGYTETSRGCLDVCRHCPVPAVYRGRFFVIDAASVLDDIAAQVAAGARHITFGDPDFLNGPRHGMAIARELHRRWPEVTFDATAQVTHLLRPSVSLAELRELGCAFVTTAVESLSDRVLAALAKRHRRRDALELFDRAQGAGLVVRPTFVPFTPWTELGDLVDLVEVIAARGLEGHVAPVQLSVRLLVPAGSLLLEQGDLAAAFGPYDPAALGHRWSHPDARVDRLQGEIAALVAAHAREGAPPAVTFAAIRARAYAAAGLETPTSRARPRSSAVVARLSEPWFC